MIKNSPFHALEQALVKWIHLVHEKKIALNGPMVDRFKKRENLEFKAITRCRSLNDWTAVTNAKLSRNGPLYSIFLSLFLKVGLSLFLSVCLFLSVSVFLSFCLCLSFSLSVCLCFSLSHYAWKILTWLQRISPITEKYSRSLDFR